MNKWISVKDRLPENYDLVLVHCSELLPKVTAIAHYQPNVNGWYKQCFSLPDEMITHWMPLPEPPEE